MLATTELLTEDTDADDSAIKYPRLANCGSESSTTNRPSTVELWRKALEKLRSVDVDPWIDFPSHLIPTRSAIRHRYSAIKKKWFADEIKIKMESVSFDRGAMRECFRMKTIPLQGSSNARTSNYVAKSYINNVNKQVYFDDVRLQMEAKLWAEAFNRQNPPKKVDIFQLSVLEFTGNVQENDGCNKSGTEAAYTTYYHIERFMEGEYRKYNSNSGFVDEQLRNTPQAFSHFTFERSGHRLLVVDIQGVGDLYTDPQIHTSDGVGYSDGNLGPKGMAYFFNSHRCNPLCEWLGLTPFDLPPSILASSNNQTSEKFHQCAADNDEPHQYCANEDENDASVSQQSSPDWLETDLADSVADHTYSRREVKVRPTETQCSIKNRGGRRRTVSFNQDSARDKSFRFGPTVARSSENVSDSTWVNQRRRCTSTTECIDLHSLTLSNVVPVYSSSRNTVLDDDGPLTNVLAALKLDVETNIPALTDQHSPLGVAIKPTVFDDKESFPRPLLLWDSVPFGLTHHTRVRAASGDSGYSARMHFFSSSTQAFDTDVSLYDDSHPIFGFKSTSNPSHFTFGSMSSLDFSTPASPVVSNSINLFSMGDSMSNGHDDFGFPFKHVNQHPLHPLHTALPVSNRLGFRPRRHRTLSESSDIDVEEGHRLAGNLLHQLMHESHKPSCADHPTNLDQEIGQSILGQIHHELARLHESGRFLPSCEGGWSYAGLGGLFLHQGGSMNSLSSLDGEISPKDNSTVKVLPHREPSIDWDAVLFHERHAAQLGCLEAMIVMAHYYLGLPTQLLLGCKAEFNASNVRCGVDYLWRAAEGGDRRCMILLARYLDLSAIIHDTDPQLVKDLKPDDLLILPVLQTANPNELPSAPPDAWSEAIVWYQKAVDCAEASTQAIDQGLDAEGGYDAAEDVLPVCRILARMAELYSHGGFGLTQDFSTAGDLFNHAGELASTTHQGRLAMKYFDLSEEAYANVE